MTNPYEERIRRELDAVAPGLFDRLESLTSLGEDQAQGVVAFLVSKACECTHVGLITMGRRALARIERPWLVSRIDAVARACLNLEDEWEFRRLLEVYSELAPALEHALALSGLHSQNPEIVEAARDFLQERRDTVG